jgi:hypothetical protein
MESCEMGEMKRAEVLAKGRVQRAIGCSLEITLQVGRTW